MICAPGGVELTLSSPIGFVLASWTSTSGVVAGRATVAIASAVGVARRGVGVATTGVGVGDAALAWRIRPMPANSSSATAAPPPKTIAGPRGPSARIQPPKSVVAPPAADVEGRVGDAGGRGATRPGGTRAPVGVRIVGSIGARPSGRVVAVAAGGAVASGVFGDDVDFGGSS